MMMKRTWTSLCRASSQSVKVKDPAMVSLPTRLGYRSREHGQPVETETGIEEMKSVSQKNGDNGRQPSSQMKRRVEDGRVK